MTTNIEIVSAEKNSTLLVPSDSLVRKAGKMTVTVVTPGGNQDREVEVGINNGQKAEILSGLSEGETVIVNRNLADSKWRSPANVGGRMMPPGLPR